MASRLERSIAGMARDYPQFSFAQRGATGIWTAEVRPVQRLSDERLMLADLADDEPVLVTAERVLHVPDCKLRHAEYAWIGVLPGSAPTFKVRIEYCGSSAVPRCFLDAPIIPPAKRMHMWSDGALCAYLVSDVWNLREGLVIDVVPYFLLWLVKWSVFDATGVWIGSQHMNSPAAHLTNISVNEPCWCGQGRKYKNCHRPLDQKAVITGRLPVPGS